MKTRQHQLVSKEDGLTMSQRNTRLKNKKKTSTNKRGRENSEPIPFDLVIEIFSRLPPKSIARCRCVSKLWASVLRLPFFTELYLTRSSSRPQLFFSSHKPREFPFVTKQSGAFLLFSAPQVQNMSLVTANDHVKFPFEDSYYSFGHLRGLACLTNRRSLKEREQTVSIYNLTTREYLNLPKVKTNYNIVKSFLVYDPIDKQFKVLSMSQYYYERHTNSISQEYQVLTLGTTNGWRKIDCSMPHFALGKRICITDDLYYLTIANERFVMVVWFDVRYEKFRFINGVEETKSWGCKSTLVNYKGKLDVIFSDGLNVATRESRSFEIWVLEDAKKHEWLKHVYVLPSLWKNIVEANPELLFVGVIAGTDEIVLAPKYHKFDRFYVYYYNFEKETIRRVEIQGMDAVKDHIVHTFLDHLEDVKLLQTL